MSTPLLASAHLMTLAAQFDEPQVIEGGPQGTRRILYMMGGTVAGAKLNGAILPRGADWVTTRADGAFQLDIRLTVRTDDDALIYVNSSGLFDVRPELRERIRKGEIVSSSEYYFRTTLSFETGAARYSWLNKTLAVGVGTRTPNGMSTEVFALT
ncbi:MAG: hypothetical protein A4S14_14100 [Proteobacteria bacterium SG_bin9]|nr:MAG: hypothetical protein A4S14_14100 [Proteobacteria bacterium SG_bin9]